MPLKEQPLVSVIIPFLNPGEWLSEAIESVINQSYSNWEIILIDDGSIDKDGAIAKQYCKNYPDKIFYTDHEGHINKGLTISRNVGIQLSKGSFIAFLDADDCWLPEKIYHQLKLFEQYPKADMICEASYFWYSWNDHKKKDALVNIEVTPGLYSPPQLIKILYPLGKGQPPCPTGIIIKREAFNRSGGFEESFSGIYQLYEDQAFLSKIYLNENVFISGTPNNLYRKRSGSMTGAGNDETLYKKVRLFYLKWLEKYLSDHPVKDEDVMELLITARKNLE